MGATDPGKDSPNVPRGPAKYKRKIDRPKPRNPYWVFPVVAVWIWNGLKKSEPGEFGEFVMGLRFLTVRSGKKNRAKKAFRPVGAGLVSCACGNGATAPDVSMGTLTVVVGSTPPNDTELI